MLSVTIRDQKELYAAFMPFIKNGALFVATDTDYELGSSVELRFEIPEHIDITTTGNIIWITPRRAQGGKVAGVGVQFNYADTKALNMAIDSYLMGFNQQDQRTDTM